MKSRRGPAPRTARASLRPDLAREQGDPHDGAALGLLTTPVVSITAATLWLREPLTMPVVVSITLILGGVALVTTGSRDERD